MTKQAQGRTGQRAGATVPIVPPSITIDFVGGQTATGVIGPISSDSFSASGHCGGILLDARSTTTYQVRLIITDADVSGPSYSSSTSPVNVGAASP